MALYTTIHLHNVPPGRETDYEAWFDGPHGRSLSALRGFKSAERFEVAAEQIMPDIPQPWRFMSVYDFDLPDPKIDHAALGPLIAEARDAGLIDDATETERLYSYVLYSDWYRGPNWRTDQPLSGISIILANFTPGREPEYHKWYDEVHSIEVSAVPGHVGMKRGRLADLQLEPKRYCPGDQLVLCAQQTDDLMFTIMDFSARARGVSPSGIAMEPRSSSGSTARTVHYFKKVGGGSGWAGGVAYSDDLSVYGRG